MVDEDIHGTWFLFKRNQGMVGGCVAVWSGKRTHPEYPDMQDRFVKPEQRNQGYGSRLVSEIEQAAKRRGRAKAGLAVSPADNPVAKEVHECIGNRQDGRANYLGGAYDGNRAWVIDLKKDFEPDVAADRLGRRPNGRLSGAWGSL